MQTLEKQEPRQEVPDPGLSMTGRRNFETAQLVFSQLGYRDLLMTATASGTLYRPIIQIA